MDAIHMPGFTGETSLYRSRVHYHSTGSVVRAGGGIVNFIAFVAQHHAQHGPGLKVVIRNENAFLIRQSHKGNSSCVPYTDGFMPAVPDSSSTRKAGMFSLEMIATAPEEHKNRRKLGSL